MPGEDERIDVLLLGGSVLHHDWSPIDELLAERLAAALRRPVRIDNLAESSHTSRDSLLKYRHLRGRHYDAVVVYHGINEVRFNNVPPELFRPEYDHYDWYRYVNAIERDRWLPRLALPYALRHVRLAAAGRFGALEVGRSWPREHWLQYGADVKTTLSLTANLEEILDTARERGEPVVLNTFAIHLPADYDPERFRRMQLDYVLHISPVKLWGKPEHVAAGVREHNRAIRALAAGRSGVYLVDQEALLPARREYFNDVCHLTVAGSTRFADNAAPALLEAVTSRDQGASR